MSHAWYRRYRYEYRPSMATDRATLIASEAIQPPRTPYRRVTPGIVLPAGADGLDLLDREDRL